MALDHFIHIYCVFVLKTFQKGHGYLCQHCQMLNCTNASIWRKERFRGCLAKTNYILILRYECLCLGGLSWKVRWGFQMWELQQLLKQTDRLTAGAITRDSGPNLPQFISSEMWLDSWHKSFPSHALGCDSLQGVLGPQIENIFIFTTGHQHVVHCILKNLYYFRQYHTLHSQESFTVTFWYVLCRQNAS